MKLRQPAVSLGILASLWLASASAQTQASTSEQETDVAFAPPRLRAVYAGPRVAWIGQMVAVDVSLWRDQRHKDQAPANFEELRVPGAIAQLTSLVIPPEVRSEGGVEFLVQQRRYVVFAQRAGQIRVPPIKASWQASDDPEPVVASSSPLSFKAQLPPGLGDQSVVIAASLELNQQIDGDLEELRVGDSFSRTLTLSARGTDALMLPTLEVSQIAGLDVYPGEPSSQTTTARGEFHATRSQKVTYVVSAWGYYRLPSVSVLWLEPESGQYHHASLGPVKFRARVNPSLGTSCLGVGPGLAGRGAWLVAAALLLSALWWASRRIRQARRQERPPDEQSRRYRELMRCVRRAQPLASLNALYRWLLAQAPPALSFEQLNATAPSLAEQGRRLESSLFAGPGAQSWQPRQLWAAIKALRRRRRRKGERSALPRLNGSDPSASSPLQRD